MMAYNDGERWFGMDIKLISVDPLDFAKMRYYLETHGVRSNSIAGTVKDCIKLVSGLVDAPKVEVEKYLASHGVAVRGIPYTKAELIKMMKNGEQY